MPDYLLPEPDVSRETMEKLGAFASIVTQWNKSINLISKDSIPDLWTRHILDSIQLSSLNLVGDRWVDLGSGGGFPAIPNAILASEFSPERHTVMIESDKRKSAFLMTAVRKLDLNASVVPRRIEDAEVQLGNVITARALTNLSDLMGLAQRFCDVDGSLVFMKGKSWQEEVQTARKLWDFDLETVESTTDANSRVLVVRNLIDRDE